MLFQNESGPGARRSIQRNVRGRGKKSVLGQKGSNPLIRRNGWKSLGSLLALQTLLKDQGSQPDWLEYGEDWKGFRKLRPNQLKFRMNLRRSKVNYLKKMLSNQRLELTSQKKKLKNTTSLTGKRLVSKKEKTNNP